MSDGEQRYGDERRELIMAQLHEQGRVQVKALAERFKVTEDAIRKDLRALESAGMLSKTYGGAVLSDKVSAFVPYRDRGEPERKRPLARAAAALIEEGDTVFVESSSYTNLLLQEIKPQLNVTVVTNSIYGLADLVRKVNLVHVGGAVHPEDEACYGPFALQTLAQMNFDKCFLKPAAISAEGQVTTGLQESLAIKQAAMRQSNHTVILLDAADWSRRDRYNVCTLGDIGTVVSNTQDEAALRLLEASKTRFVPGS
ncbi:DeoR/GlpR family DNA-binding transcription regulator [Paenibacillus sp. MBLB4367]|uniref:DeoR/GlpR family DNA-binding transcription regulator n=1 Tax=Paenibacillus sp. MBLB4367 TaxID=3384767 RepID=UPI0039080327